MNRIVAVPVLVLFVFGSFLWGCSGSSGDDDKGPSSYCPDGLVELPDGSCGLPDGDSVDVLCDDGEFSCSLNVLYYCISGNWSKVQDCNPNSLCDAFAGKCVPNSESSDGDEETISEQESLDFEQELADGDEGSSEVVEVDVEEDSLPETEQEPELPDAEESVADAGILKIDPQRDRALMGFDVVLHAMWKQSEDSQEVDLTSSVVWSSSNESVLSPIAGSAGQFHAASAGTALISATYTVGNATATDSVQITVYERAAYEARGLWVTRWSYSSADDVRQIIRRAAQYGFNQVYFQVRGRCDAFYASNIEPWASELSGHLGRDPGWDPLEVAVQEAHQQGIELHAYINILTMWSGSSAPPNTNPQHVYNAHPEWRMADSSGNPMPLGSGYVWMSPGIPDVWQYTADVVEDIITNYDVDGIHMDRIRYPGTDYSFDSVSNQRYAQASAQNPGLTREQWQRDQITALVQTVYERIQSVRPRVVLSAATIGIYKRPSGWGSSSGWSDYFQDPYAWDELGIIDANIPMVYWHIRSQYGAYTDFKFLVDDHVSHAHNRFVYIGSDFEDSSFSSGYIDASELSAQVEYVRGSGAAGHVFFDYTTLNSSGLWGTFGSSLYAEPAVVPWMPWKH